jgi:thioredoxin
MSQKVQSIASQKQLEQIMSEDSGPAMIDFWAPWCGPCKAMGPHFEEVAERYASEPIEFYKLDTEAHPALARAFNIRSIPTTLLVFRGEIADVVVGALDAERIDKKARWLLDKASGKSWLSRLVGK